MTFWLRLSRGDVVAGLIILAMLAGFTLLAWLANPAAPASVTKEAIVVSQAPGLQGRSGKSRIHAIVRLRLDDGTPLSLGRAIDCLPALKPNDRVRLSGVRNKAGAMTWYLTGEGCSF